MATNESYLSSERSAYMSHLFGLLGKLHLLFLAALVVFPQLLLAQWNATAGAQSHNLGRQGLAFLPNEIWIHSGDSITWTVEADEPHTVTFLTSEQIRPPFTVGCPGFSEVPRSSTVPAASRAHFSSKVRSLPLSFRWQATSSSFVCCTTT
jgi:plastocyanin